MTLEKLFGGGNNDNFHKCIVSVFYWDRQAEQSMDGLKMWLDHKAFKYLLYCSIWQHEKDTENTEKSTI